jgi:hypothetical protein
LAWNHLAMRRPHYPPPPFLNRSSSGNLEKVHVHFRARVSLFFLASFHSSRGHLNFRGMRRISKTHTKEHESICYMYVYVNLFVHDIYKRD